MDTDLDPLTRTALVGLDPAPVTLTAAQEERAAAALDRILATAPEPNGSYPPALPGTSRRRRTRRVVLAGAAAGSLAVGVAAVHLLSGAQSAAATWTATPHRATTAQEVSFAEACRDSLLESFDGDSTTGPLGIAERTVRNSGTVLAEQRGDWTLVVLAGRQGFDALCLDSDGPGLGREGFSTMASSLVHDVGAREVRVSTGATAATEDDSLSILAGSVGTEVTGVVLHTRDRGDVVATVTGGRFAAWWPEARRPPGDEVPPPDLRPEATLTFGDGTMTRTSLRDGGGGAD